MQRRQVHRKRWVFGSPRRRNQNASEGSSSTGNPWTPPRREIGGGVDPGSPIPGSNGIDKSRSCRDGYAPVPRLRASGRCRLGRRLLQKNAVEAPRSGSGTGRNGGVGRPGPRRDPVEARDRVSRRRSPPRHAGNPGGSLSPAGRAPARLLVLTISVVLLLVAPTGMAGFHPGTVGAPGRVSQYSTPGATPLDRPMPSANLAGPAAGESADSAPNSYWMSPAPESTAGFCEGCVGEGESGSPTSLASAPTWENLSQPGAPVPSAREGASMAFDADGNAQTSLLFGGQSPGGILNDTWEYADGNWTPTHPPCSGGAPGCPPRSPGRRWRTTPSERDSSSSAD